MAELPTGTVTFLFTDLEGSTSLWEEHTEAMPDALARHDLLLHAAVESHAGHVVKSTGDGIHAVFANAPDAVDAAVAAARALSSEAWEVTGPLRVRIGIHTGSAQERDGDYFGPALNRAARLMATAHGGQVVLSQVSAELVRDALPADLGIEDLGAHRLRGLSRPEHAYQLTIAGLPARFPPLKSLDAFPESARLPGPSFAPVVETLVGRGVELDRLRRAWESAGDGARQVALVAGEPGTGKTRLAAELACDVAAQGGAVLYGRCDEEAIVPYQPFVEALRPYLGMLAPSTLHEHLHGLEQDLARVFPELLGRIPGPAHPARHDPEAERYRLFEAITTLLVGICATRSAVLLLDDLHWADKPTLLLLRHVLRSTPAAALLVVLCYRDRELARGHPLADLVADLRRQDVVTGVALDGLSEPGSEALLRGIAGHEVTPPFAAALHRVTGGNPLFLEELLRHLIETEALAAVATTGTGEVDLAALDLPAGVRDVVARRLRRLPSPVEEVLDVAAVVGLEFDAALLGRAADRPIEDVLDSLDLAVDAGLVREQPGPIPLYAFSHDLIRQTVDAELGSAQRARLHARIGAAMEVAGGTTYPSAALAHHFAQAVALGTAAKAIEYATRAGRDAVADLAFEDAASSFELALHFLDQHGPPDASRRVELLIDRADALVYVDEQAGVEAALDAVEAARAEGSPEQFARGVAVFVEPAFSGHPGEVGRLFDEAIAALGELHPALRARLLALEAFKYASQQLHGRDGRALADEALNLARTVGDPLTLADALYARAYSLEGTPGVAERVAIGEELVALGERVGGRAATATAYGLRVLAGAHLDLGDADALSSTIVRLTRIGEDLRWLPAKVYAVQWRATQALLEGRFDEVRVRGIEMRGYTRAYRAVGGFHQVQSFYLAREQGELAILAAPMARIAEEQPDSLYVRAMFALALLEANDETAAAHELDVVLADEFRREVHQSSWAASLALLAEVAATCGTAEHASILSELLAPFEGRLLSALTGLACLGAADRYLGMLGTVLERWDESSDRFESAVALETQIRGHALLARTRYWQARLLGARGRTGDAQASAALLRGVVEETSRLGMRRLCEQARALGGR